MYQWEDAVLEWISAQGDVTKLQAFYNTVLGEPFTDRGMAPPVDRIMLRRQMYVPEILHIGDDGRYSIIDARLPPGPLVLTMGADVQHDRIECEFVAWGKDKESWSVGYHIIPGDTSDLDGPAWETLKYILSQPTHGGIPLSLALIDSGDQAPTVYAFCDRYQFGVVPSKGADSTLDGRRVFKIFDVTGHQCKRVDLDTSHLKREFYIQTKVGPIDAPADDARLPAGYCHFPHDDDSYGRRYFEKLYSEDEVIKRTPSGGVRRYWDNGGRRNEALDCRVYALGALYVVASGLTAPSDDKTGAVDWPLFWEYLLLVKTS
jgi:phage terminase large subunit GpA-like protein